MNRGLTLDAGALIALDRNDRRVLALLQHCAETAERITIPTTALAQAARSLSRQARLSRLLRQATSDVRSLDRPDAVAAGRLLALSGTADIADAHVVVCARRAGQAVVTTDPDDLRRLDPTLRLLAL
ncbi:MAG: PIN domain-containing protein [Actinomycetota bacterium]|nr:PIN domain-containing protein [Actinomycetota bacterium]